MKQLLLHSDDFSRRQFVAQAAKTFLGVSALPREILQRELDTGLLRRFDVDATVPDLAFSAAYRASPGGTVVHAIAELALATARERAAVSAMEQSQTTEKPD